MKAATPPPFANARGRLVGFADDGPITPASRLVRDFRGWLWQDGRCVDERGGDRIARGAPSSACACRWSCSARPCLPRGRRASSGRRPTWTRSRCRSRCWRPARARPVRQQCRRARTAPFSWSELTPLLLPGEKLRIRKLGAGGAGHGRRGAVRRGGRGALLAADRLADTPAAGRGLRRARHQHRHHQHAAGAL